MRARPRTVSTWGDRLKRARNILALVMLGVLFAIRAGVTWRRWQRRQLARVARD
jgi:hypothetical protein